MKRITQILHDSGMVNIVVKPDSWNAKGRKGMNEHDRTRRAMLSVENNQLDVDTLGTRR